jgi:pimeloyl-ACP methyl ester carboxylesterase
MPVLRSELRVRTEDGVELAIARLSPAQQKARGAVVLQHGLGCNGLAFVMPGVSLAERLCALGYDCFVPDLRGAGRSARPRTAFGLDAYIEHDIPAILAAALEHSGASAVHWVGHSMGALLMWMYGIEHPDAPVARLCAVGSAIDYRPGQSVYRSLQRLLPIASLLLPSVPFALIGRASALVAGQGPLLLPEAMNFHRSNVERDVCRRFMSTGFSPIPVPLFDALKTTFSEHGFSRANGAIVYLPRVAEFRIPTLLIGGSRDPQATPEAVQATFAHLSGVTDKRLVMCGKAHGHGEDYGHIDLLIGKRAAHEVWPHIEAFLEGQSATQAEAV